MKEGNMMHWSVYKIYENKQRVEDVIPSRSIAEMTINKRLTHERKEECIVLIQGQQEMDIWPLFQKEGCRFFGLV